MRVKCWGLIILFGFLAISCATTGTGPRFIDLQAKQQQEVAKELESNWSQYIIYFIPERAVLFDRRDDGNTLVVSGRWIKFGDNKKPWMEILKDNIQTTDSIWAKIMGATTGFHKIIGPDEQVFGYLIHEKMDLVALKVIDRHTMRIYYSTQKMEVR